DVWNSNAFSLSIEYEAQQLEELKDNYGIESFVYADALFDYGVLQIEYYDFDKALTNLMQAMSIFENLDKKKEISNGINPLDSLYYPQYLQKLPDNWRLFIKNEEAVNAYLFGN